MQAIRTKYCGPTDTRGSRIVATAEGGPKPHRVSVPYDHESDDPHREAALALCRKMGWTGMLGEGGLPDGSVAWVFVDKVHLVEVKS